MKLKLMTILGTRPEIIRLSETIKLCDKFFNHVLVHTGQNYDYELNQIFFDELELRPPDYFLNCAGDNLGQTMGNILAKSYEILSKEKPNAVLILGDTIPHCQPFLPSGSKFRFSTWRRAIAVGIGTFPK